MIRFHFLIGQSFAEQKHALKFHTVIILCNHKTGYTIDIQKCQNQHTLNSTQGNLGAHDKMFSCIIAKHAIFENLVCN